MYEKARFTTLCPNCEGEITDIRLRIKNPCEHCLDKEIRAEEYEKLVQGVFEALEQRGSLKKYQTIHDVISRTADFRQFFRKATGLEIWSAQRTWAKRFFIGKSFSIVAPTGIGKTSFGMVLALYLAREGEKTYILVPTTALLLQIEERLKEFAERAYPDARIVAIHGKLRKKEKEERIERVRSGDFDILITTTQFLTRNFDMVKAIKFDLVFVDDVDAILRASKNIDRILQMLGYDEEILAKTYELIKAKFTIVFRRNDKELSKKIDELQREIDTYKETHRTGQIIVSTATGSAHGIRVKLFRELMGFDIGSTRANLRKITNVFTALEDSVRQTVDIIHKMGKGGLIFVPTDKGKAFAERLVQELSKKGISAVLATGNNVNKVIPEFQSGKIDVLVGIAAYYGAIVRGIDLPEAVRYAVFTGVPKFKFNLRFEGAPEGRIAYLLDVVADHVEDEKRASELRRLANRVRRMKKEEDVEQARRLLETYFSDRSFIDKIKESEEVAIIEENGEIKILIADAKTYIQASGRTSRMYAGGVTEGASFVLVDDRRVFKQLERYLRYVLDEEFIPLEDVDVEELKTRIDESRAKIGKAKNYDPVKTVLFIVESPNKARTIANFFGKPSVYRIGGVQGYEVTTGKYILNVVATRGHMFDLVTDRGIHGVENKDGWFVPVYTTIKYCRRCGVQTVENVCPVCGSSEYLEDAQWRVNALRVFALESDYAIIGTDPDREGEKIAWDTALAISPYVPTLVRAEFHEVTRSAILRALEETREIDEHLVEAQIVRRIEDRWIGFELSSKLQDAFGNRTLSAGRVQTPVLGWIIKRNEEHKKSVAVFLSVRANDQEVVFETPYRSTKEAEKSVRGKALEVRIKRRWSEEINPLPPFSTDAMLREATTKMKIGTKDVMALAQDLFEAGFITYHRTDTTRVSPAGMAVAREYIRDRFGEERYKGRSWGEGGAHECIRPTKPMDTETLIRLLREGELNIQGLTKKHLYLYSIIFSRFMASQMIPAKVEKAEVEYSIEGLKTTEERIINVLEPGWYLIRPVQIANVREGTYAPDRIKAFKMAKIPLYSQADIVALMREKGIGRPSTYATIIQKLLDRKYVMESKAKGKLYPTPLGIKVYEFLAENYGKFVSEERTQRLEETLDRIAAGDMNYQDAIREDYEEIREIRGET